MEYGVLKRFKNILKNFCKQNSVGEKEVYFSLAGAGRGAIENRKRIKKQIFRLEIFISFEEIFKNSWKENFSFPFSFCKNYLVLMGEDVKKYLQYVGENENLINLFDGFDKLQWVVSSILEFDFNEEVLFVSCREGIYFDVSNLILAYGINEKRKTHVFFVFKKLFPEDYLRFKTLFDQTMKLRAGKRIEISSKNYFQSYLLLNKFVSNKINEKIREVQ